MSDETSVDKTGHSTRDSEYSVVLEIWSHGTLSERIELQEGDTFGTEFYRQKYSIKVVEIRTQEPGSEQTGGA